MINAVAVTAFQWVLWGVGQRETQWRRLLPAIKVSQSLQTESCKDQHQFTMKTITRSGSPSTVGLSSERGEKAAITAFISQEEGGGGGWSGQSKHSLARRLCNCNESLRCQFSVCHHCWSDLSWSCGWRWEMREIWGSNKCENSCSATGANNPCESSTNFLNVKFEKRFLSHITQRKCIIEIFVGDQI